ncbi:MAG: hypothetical protein ACLSHC_00365 [Bilophila wadsworthia]
MLACVRYNNTHHDFMMLNALAETTPTRAAVAQPPPRSENAALIRVTAVPAGAHRPPE